MTRNRLIMFGSVVYSATALSAAWLGHGALALGAMLLMLVAINLATKPGAQGPAGPAEPTA